MTDYLIKEAAEKQMELQGVILTFFPERNFGFIGPIDGDRFIMPNGNGGDIFLHMQALTDSNIDAPPEVAAEISFKVELLKDDANKVRVSFVESISPGIKHKDTVFSKPVSDANVNDRENTLDDSSKKSPRDFEELYTLGLRPREIIDRALSLVRDELKDGVKKIIHKEYGNDWYEKVTAKRGSLGPVPNNIDKWDAYAIITTITALDKISDLIFRRFVPRPALAYIEILHDFRNKTAHAKNEHVITYDDALFVIDNASRLLQAVGKTDSSDLLKEVKVRFSKDIEKGDKATTKSDPANESNPNVDTARESKTIDEAHWDASAKLTRVFIGTTQGPIELLSLEMSPDIGHSLIRVNNSTERASITKSYDNLVRADTGVITSWFGEGPYRANISSDIQDGKSWELGMFTAHCLHSQGNLANEEDKAGAAIWVTGSISTSVTKELLPVLPVEKIPLKIQRSKDLFADILRQGVDITIVVPDANSSQLHEIEAQLSGVAHEGRVLRIITAKNCAQMCLDALDIHIEPAPEHQGTSDPRSPRRHEDTESRKLLWRVSGGVTIAGLVVYALYSGLLTSSPPQTMQTPATPNVFLEPENSAERNLNPGLVLQDQPQINSEVDLGVQWDEFD